MAHIKVVIPAPRPPLDTTVQFYDANAADYVEATQSNDLSAFYLELLGRLPSAGLVLDAGCGSGRDISAFLTRGFRVEAFDASPALALLASERSGVDVAVQRFEDWEPPLERYDGIWCFASLLHVARPNLADVLRKLRTALKRQGWLFASFKHGEGDSIDERGRLYTNLTVTFAHCLFERDAGFRLERIWEEAGPSGLGDKTNWVYVLAQR